MKRVVQWGLALIFLFSVLNLALANDEAQIKELIKAYQNGVLITKAQYQLIKPFLKKPSIPIIRNSYPSSKGALNEDFESGVWPPDGWSLDNDGNGDDWDLSNQENDHTSGSGYYARYNCYYISSGNEGYLITPQLSVTSTSHTLSFWVNYYFVSGSWGNTAELYVDVSNDDGTSWVSGTTNYISGQSGAGWFQVTIDLSNYEGNNFVGDVVKVRFRAVSDYGSYNIGIDDVTGPDIYVPAGLPGEPTNPNPANGATNIATTTGISWTNGANTDSTIVLFGTSTPPIDTVYDGTAVSSLTNAQIGGPLSGGTTYYWRVLAKNSSGQTNGPIWSFMTASPAHSFPLTEDFESGFDKFDNAGGNSVDWTLNTTLYHGGTQSAHNAYGSSNTNILHETGVLDLSSTTNPRLYFWQIAKTEGGYDKCYVEISTDGGANYTPLPASTYLGNASDYATNGYFHEDSYTEWGTTNVTPDNSWWKQEIFDLSNYKTTNVRFRFRLTSDGSVQRYGWLLDDIEIKEAPTNPIIGVTPDTLDFGYVPVNDSKTGLVSISNTGGSNLNITGVSVNAPFSSTYSGTIAPGVTDTAYFTFNPTSAGSFTETATFNISGAYNGDNTLVLTGTGYNPYSTLNENFDASSSLPNGWTTIVYSTSSWAYAGISSSYAHSSPNSLKLYNSSDDQAYIMAVTPKLSVAANGSRLKFWARSSSGTQTLYVGTMSDPADTNTFVPTDTFTVTSTFTQYTAEFSGSKRDIYIAFKHGLDDTYDSYYIDDITWEEIPTTPVFSISPESADFGTVNISDTSAAQTFTITNTGAGTLTITSVSITGTNADQFLMADTNAYPVDLGTNQSMGFDIYFAPTSTGNKSAYLTVVDNLTRTTRNYPLTGTGYDPNYGGGGNNNGGYYFANSLATNAPSHPTFNWVDISSTGTDIIGDLTDDSFAGPFNIGFTFNFFGNDYTQLYISSNGWISFDEPGSSVPSNTNIPNANLPNNIIALFWDDLNPASSSVTDKHLYIGNAPNGDYVISLVNYPEYGADADGWITCQAILKQNGNIKFQYYEHGSSIDLNGATVGIENSDGTAGVQYRYNTSGGPLFGSPLAVEFGMDDQSLPVELNSFVAQAGNNRAFLKWTTQSEVNNLGFEIYRSTSESGEYQMIASYENYDNLRGAGNSNTTHTYAFTDANVLNGITYYYKLADVSMNGQKHFHGPVSVIPNKNGADLKNTGLIPKTFALKNNFPNPFNPTTTIGFDIPMVPGGKIHVDLSIYNMLGQKVRTLVSDVLTPGSYQITWDGRNENGAIVANGIYFYGIRTEKFTRFKKMILMK